MDEREKRFRPKHHYTPVKNWMNDPNGCVYQDGQYHLFYQYHTESNKWGPMHWGHAVSRDLINWDEKDVALYPDESGFAFSGSAVEDAQNSSGLFDDEKGLVFLYTGHIDEPQEGGDPLQHQCLAFSKDGGLTYEKYKRNPVIPNPGKKDFRDPKVVFHEETSQWIMVLASGDHLDFYHSEDLLHWSFASSIQPELKNIAGVWECPDLFSLIDQKGSKHWILTLSVLSEEAAGAQLYFVGQFDGRDFCRYSEDFIGVADYGFDFYAAQSWSNLPDEDRQKLWIGWGNNWNYANETPEMAWRGLMSFPREVTLMDKSGDLFLLQKPGGDLDSVKRGIFSRSDLEPGELSIKTDASVSQLTLKGIEIEEHSDLEIVFHWSEGATLSLTLDRYSVQLDRNGAGELFETPKYGNSGFDMPGKERLNSMDFYLDKCITEIYFNDGLAVMTNQIFPEGDLKKITIRTGSGSKVANCTLWRM